MKNRVAIAAALLLALSSARSAPTVPKGLEYVEPDADFAVVVKVDFIDHLLEEVAAKTGQGDVENPSLESMATYLADVRKNILPALGGEIVLASKRSAPQANSVSQAVSEQVLLVAPVRDGAALDAALRTLLEESGGSVEVAPDGTNFLRLASTSEKLCYRQQSGYVFLSSDPATIDRALARERSRDGLHATAAFGNAIADLRDDPEALVFLRDGRSFKASQGAAVPPEGADTPVLALAMYRTDRGTIFEVFSPGKDYLSTFSNPLMALGRGFPGFAGMTTAQPNPQTETFRRVQMWGMRLGVMKAQTMLPGPTLGFVHLSSIAGQLPGAPVPFTDGWGWPLLYRFDGAHYTVMSLGRNGAYDSALLGKARQAAVVPEDLDLVYHDGDYVQTPGKGLVEDELALASPPASAPWDPKGGAVPQIVAGDVEPPRLSTKVKPVYPEEARRSKIEGKVFLQAIITETGKVEDVRVLNAAIAPDLGLSDAAARAVRDWVYEPAKKDGKPVRVYFTVVVDFRLE